MSSPPNVRQLRDNAFDNCESLSSITIYTAYLYEPSANVFDNNAEDRKIYVPGDIVDDYRKIWSPYTNDIQPLTPTVNFAKEDYSTYYNSMADISLPAGMKARIVTGNEGNNLTYETIADGNTDQNTVPAGTAVLLQVEESTEIQPLSFTLVTMQAEPISQVNYLHGSDEPTPTTGAGEGGKYDMLTYNSANQDFGWYWGATNGAAFNSGAHKARIAIPQTAQIKERTFIELPSYAEDNTTPEGATAIENTHDVSRTTDNDTWHTLSGMKLNAAPTEKGIYIHNHTKVVIE